jgi:hypothetical protein
VKKKVSVAVALAVCGVTVAVRVAVAGCESDRWKEEVKAVRMVFV